MPMSPRDLALSCVEKNDIAVVMQWFRWSNIAGTALNLPLEETQPGRYWETGLRVDISSVAAWIIVGASIRQATANFPKLRS